MTTGDPPGEQTPLCARCGQPLIPDEPSVTLAGGALIHQRCADAGAEVAARQPPGPCRRAGCPSAWRIRHCQSAAVGNAGAQIRRRRMGNMLTATVTIVGVRPLLWHRFGPDAIPLIKQEKTGVAGNDPEEWRRTVLAMPDNQLYLDPTAVFGCLRDAARFTPRKRGTLQPFLSATLQVCSEQVLIDRYLPAELGRDPAQPVYIDVRSVRNPTTRARNVRYRVAASAGVAGDLSDPVGQNGGCP